MDRRSFQSYVIGGLSALMGLALSVPAVAYLFATPKSRRKSDWVDAGDISGVKIGAPEEVVFKRTRIDGWKVTTERTTAWVIRKNEKDVVALAPQCTHLGCAYHWAAEKGEFECPCHASGFSMEGEVLFGPAPRPLDRYQVKLQGKHLLLGPVRRQA